MPPKDILNERRTLYFIVVEKAMTMLIVLPWIKD
jgi:hypothetical protein